MSNPKSYYSVSTVYYNNLDSGEYTIKGKSYKSFQYAVKHFNLLWDINDSFTGSSGDVETVIKHLFCALNCYKYNQDAKLLLKNMYQLVLDYEITIDSTLACSSSKVLLNSSIDYTY